jgi:hypothetical protein
MTPFDGPWTHPEVRPDVPLTTNSVWKFTSDDLFDAGVEPAVVRAADAKVPVVGPGGKRVQEENGVMSAFPETGTYKTALYQAHRENRRPDFQRRANPVTGKTAPNGGALKKTQFTDPRLWTVPAQWAQENDLAYAVRLELWNSKRASVAKRLGVTLT